MEFTKDNYKLKFEEDNEGVDIYLYEFNDLNFTNPLIFLNLKPLDEIDTEFDDKTVIRDIPRELFSKGDYYQSSVTKYTTDDIYKKVSLLAIVHDILLDNKKDILFLKSIFSSSLNYYKEEVFFHPIAINFWNIQLSKNSIIPVSYYKEDRRYKLIINA